MIAFTTKKRAEQEAVFLRSKLPTSSVRIEKRKNAFFVSIDDRVLTGEWLDEWLRAKGIYDEYVRFTDAHRPPRNSEIGDL